MLSVRRVVWGITAMRRMSTLANMNHTAGEFQAKLAEYKEESEKEDVHEVRSLFFVFSLNTVEERLTGTRGITPA